MRIPLNTCVGSLGINIGPVGKRKSRLPCKTSRVATGSSWIYSATNCVTTKSPVTVVVIGAAMVYQGM
jgi:hypothetical protein